MKQSLSRSWAGFSVVVIGLATIFGAGCRTVTQPQTPPGPPTSLPSAGIVGIRCDGSSGNSGDFEIDLFVVDSSGHSITTLPANSISMISTLDTVFSQTNVSSIVSSVFGAYSSELLLDQTGSIRWTDPLNLRLIAAKLFLDATPLLNASNEVQLSTFQDSLHIDGEWLHSYGPFMHNTTGYEDTVETLADRVGGGTPLYDAMYDDIDSLALQASNANKVLVVFTDGEDNESGYYYPGATIWSTIQHAVSQHVKVFAVALQTGLDTALVTAAIQTNGGVMHADDAKQMVSYFHALPSIIQGGSQLYQTKWHVSLPNAASLHGRTISGNLSISLPDHSNVIAPFAVTFP